MTEKLNDTQISRRKFLKTTTLAMTGGAVAFGGASVMAFKNNHLQLRPPGALDEDLFLASCIKCGQCLQVCPPQIVKLAGISQGFGIGTPYIIPREGACILCSGLPCVLSCPTGALSHDLSHGKDAKMGLAVITNQDTCLSVLGINDLLFQLKELQIKNNSSLDKTRLQEILAALLKKITSDEKKEWQKKFTLKDISEKTISDQTISKLVNKLNDNDLQWIITFVSSSKQTQKSCQVCLEVCPIKDEKPIIFVSKTNGQTGKAFLFPTVTKTCVGCGVCEEKCPTKIASIKITPRLEWSSKTNNQNKNE